MSKYDVIQEVNLGKTFAEVLKFNPYHDRLGRFTSAGGGAASSAVIRSDKYKELLPKNSYLNNPMYREAREVAAMAHEEHDKLWTERKALEAELKNESAPKPKDQWTEEDEFNAIMGDRPKTYTEKGKELKERLDEVTRDSLQAMKNRDYASEIMDDIKIEAHNLQAADHEYTMPKKATQTEYEGFKTDDTGTSHGNDLMKRGYLAEMSPKEYLERCAFEIFDEATMESTIMGTESANVAKYTKMMQQGVKFDTPYLDYVGEGQEGRHRAMAAYNLGIEKIPVVVRDSAASNAVTMKQKKAVVTKPADDFDILDDEWLLDM